MFHWSYTFQKHFSQPWFFLLILIFLRESHSCTFNLLVSHTRSDLSTRHHLIYPEMSDSTPKWEIRFFLPSVSSVNSSTSCTNNNQKFYNKTDDAPLTSYRLIYTPLVVTLFTLTDPPSVITDKPVSPSYLYPWSCTRISPPTPPTPWTPFPLTGASEDPKTKPLTFYNRWVSVVTVTVSLFNPPTSLLLLLGRNMGLLLGRNMGHSESGTPCTFTSTTTRNLYTHVERVRPQKSLG